MSETEYVEGLNAFTETAVSDIAASTLAYEQIVDPTKTDLVARLDRENAIGSAARQEFDALDPPDSLADVHRVIDDVLARSLGAGEGLVAVANTVSTLEEMEQTPEFGEYQAVNVDSHRICLDVQAKLDDLVSAGTRLDNPWIPTLRLAVQAALGCDTLGTAGPARG